ncbi:MULTISPECIES: A/G-specific adenine glycosylase [unclassified Rathayibacter]|jgi:A/G-specific adenine glycosylase|uniref:A/G-specific adenine glycosylase n=1 Tax=unclassified Rathayibacter TaxID=2609250 RepID=UPI000CE7628B|nr:MULTISPECIES: A/G-specific adenine glycosylase [unclassified Rathayibacter]PPF20186.1 adenine glycosylase [Rathayibacter sp. AY1A4]PPF40898.1 adenine glycosylase [Rathayibacter sp. AY1A3]PPF73843.1 adenine glycosylase [Rathayibacter sp. AY1E6]PPG18641.1 adenine glycosylase [Rathayibacter sp. AY1C6]PPG88596.1 adenine glycosylase [Rathayibacter sp. AY1F3]
MPSDPLADAITAWFRTSARDLPWRREGFPAWGTLVSEFMLQQTPVVRVVPRLAEWLERWPTPSALAAVPPGEAVRAWQSLGYPRRALRLHACAVAIAEEHGDVVPDDVETLLALPGIGDYTARAIAVFAYGRRHPVVDTNVRRVLARAVDGAAEPGPPRARADLAAMSALLPESLSEAAAFNAGAMELGAIVCTARAPRCDECPIRDLCRWRAEGYPEHTGPVKAKQKRFEGSDRQVRGLILAELRAAHGPVTAAEVESLWPDADQRGRALAGLLADGLATGGPEDGYLLPGS